MRSSSYLSGSREILWNLIMNCHQYAAANVIYSDVVLGSVRTLINVDTVVGFTHPKEWKDKYESGDIVTKQCARCSDLHEVWSRPALSRLGEEKRTTHRGHWQPRRLTVWVVTSPCCPPGTPLSSSFPAPENHHQTDLVKGAVSAPLRSQPDTTIAQVVIWGNATQPSQLGNTALHKIVLMKNRTHPVDRHNKRSRWTKLTC